MSQSDLLRRPPPPADAECLSAFVTRADQEAFRALVERYHRLVFAVCRQALQGDAAAADDASQAVFILLARKAGTVAPHALAGWLYQTSRRVVSTLQRQERRRKNRERRAAWPKEASMPHDMPAALDQPQLDAALQAAIQKLPAKQRDALLLCYFTGVDQATAAARLGCTTKALQKRIAYGLETLRKRLARSSFVLALPVLQATLDRVAAVHAPADLAARCQAAVFPAAGQATVAAQLAQEVLRQSALKLILTATAATLGVAATISTVVVAIHFSGAAAPLPSTAGPAAIGSSAPQAVKPPILMWQVSSATTAPATGPASCPDANTVNRKWNLFPPDP